MMDTVIQQFPLMRILQKLKSDIECEGLIFPDVYGVCVSWSLKLWTAADWYKEWSVGLYRGLCEKPLKIPILPSPISTDLMIV